MHVTGTFQTPHANRVSRHLDYYSIRQDFVISHIARFVGRFFWVSKKKSDVRDRGDFNALDLGPELDISLPRVWRVYVNLVMGMGRSCVRLSDGVVASHCVI